MEQFLSGLAVGARAFAAIGRHSPTAVELFDNQRWTTYRTDGFDTNFNGGVFGTAFVEYRPLPRTSITLDVDNALNTSGNLEPADLLPQPRRSEVGDPRGRAPQQPPRRPADA